MYRMPYGLFKKTGIYGFLGLMFAMLIDAVLTWNSNPLYSCLRIVLALVLTVVVAAQRPFVQRLWWWVRYPRYRK